QHAIKPYRPAERVDQQQLDEVVEREPEEAVDVAADEEGSAHRAVSAGARGDVAASRSRRSSDPSSSWRTIPSKGGPRSIRKTWRSGMRNSLTSNRQTSSR